MKSLLITILITINTLGISSSYAARGNSSGGGGDASEARVDEIRSDILKWISNDGAKGLKFPNDLSVGEYVDRMKDILQPQKVIIGFTNEKVLVNKVEKTCRGFLDLNKRPHVLCNINRFKETKDSEQYTLIHHEYAGLAGVEANEGGASDYIISTQLTGYLEQQVVLKLTVKKDPQSTLDIEAVREAMKMQIQKQGVDLYKCYASGEASTYDSGKGWIEQLDDMTSVKRTASDNPDVTRYVFSYVDNKDVKYEQAIYVDDSTQKIVGNIIFTILKKKRVNTGTIGNPNFIMDYALVGKYDCETTRRQGL